MATLPTPLSTLKTKLKETTKTDEFLLGSARLLVTKVEGMVRQALESNYDALTFSAKEVLAARQEMVFVTGTVLHACISGHGGDDRLLLVSLFPL